MTSQKSSNKFLNVFKVFFFFFTIFRSCQAPLRWATRTYQRAHPHTHPPSLKCVGCKHFTEPARVSTRVWYFRTRDFSRVAQDHLKRCVPHKNIPSSHPSTACRTRLPCCSLTRWAPLHFPLFPFFFKILKCCFFSQLETLSFFGKYCVFKLFLIANLATSFSVFLIFVHMHQKYIWFFQNSIIFFQNSLSTTCDRSAAMLTMWQKTSKKVTWRNFKALPLSKGNFSSLIMFFRSDAKHFDFPHSSCVFDFFCTCSFAKSYQAFHIISHSYHILSNLTNHNLR